MTLTPTRATPTGPVRTHRAPGGEPAPTGALPDRRVVDPTWGTSPLGRVASGPRVRLLVAVNLLAAAWYFGWLLVPGRVGNPVLYGLLLAAEAINLVGAVGFWWTLLHEKVRPPAPEARGTTSVDVLVPRYDESAAVVGPVLAAAVRLRGARVTVWLLDDGDDDEMAELARTHGARYLRRPDHAGAKAGNINHALQHTDGELVLVLDCDHVPHEDLLVRTVGHLERDHRVAVVQTPQHYANGVDNDVAAAAWSQQALFFGCIGRGKDSMGAMFCCGTGMVLRRAALTDVGDFPTDSVTEDFQLSIRLHAQGWRSVYVPEVLAQGLGPEDLASYTSQQLRWARGCLSAVPSALRARLPWRLRTQYLLSSLYFLSGWSLLVYLSLPVVRILTGAQPLAAADADQFLLHFAPYFVLALVTVSLAGGGTYTFRAYAQAAATSWVHVVATLAVLTRRRGRFVVTPKTGAGGRQLGAVWPTLVILALLLAVAVVGLLREQDAAMYNNVCFALLHVCVLATGVAPALRSRR